MNIMYSMRKFYNKNTTVLMLIGVLLTSVLSSIVSLTWWQYHRPAGEEVIVREEKYIVYETSFIESLSQISKSTATIVMLDEKPKADSDIWKLSGTAIAAATVLTSDGMLATNAAALPDTDLDKLYIVREDKKIYSIQNIYTHPKRQLSYLKTKEIIPEVATETSSASSKQALTQMDKNDWQPIGQTNSFLRPGEKVAIVGHKWQRINAFFESTLVKNNGESHWVKSRDQPHKIQLESQIDVSETGGPVVDIAGNTYGVSVLIDGDVYVEQIKGLTNILASISDNGHIRSLVLDVDVRVIDEYLQFQLDLPVSKGVLIERLGDGFPELMPVNNPKKEEISDLDIELLSDSSIEVGDIILEINNKEIGLNATPNMVIEELLFDEKVQIRYIDISAFEAHDILVEDFSTVLSDYTITSNMSIQEL